jgi:hypothetical protein
MSKNLNFRHLSFEFDLSNLPASRQGLELIWILKFIYNLCLKNQLIIISN